MERKRPLRLWDAALAFMVLASLGAWGIALTVIFDMRDPIVSAAITIPALAIWAERSLLRVSYLHWLLLGFVSLGLIVVAETTWGKTEVPARRWLNLTVIFLILTLIPPTPFWSLAWSGIGVRQLAAIATLGPISVTIVMFGRGFAAYRQAEAGA